MLWLVAIVSKKTSTVIFIVVAAIVSYVQQSEGRPKLLNWEHVSVGHVDTRFA